MLSRSSASFDSALLNLILVLPAVKTPSIKVASCKSVLDEKSIIDHVIATKTILPPVEQGDYIIIQDTGAYTLNMWSGYNSRQIPKVIGYLDEGELFEILRVRESLDDLLAFWS